MKKSLGAKTIVFPAPAWAVGTFDKKGRANLATVAWGGICCSIPPCVSISLREATYSYENIMARKAFTVNVASDNFIKELDYCGIYSGRDVDKFSVTKLTAVKSDLVDAPYVKEFCLILECKVIKVVKIGLHTQFIGEIIDVKADEGALDGDGHPDITKIKPVIFASSARSYYGIGAYLGKAFSIGKPKA